MNYTEEISEPEAIEALADCVQQVWNNFSVFALRSQTSVTTEGFYNSTDDLLWTDGFWSGELALAFEASHDSNYQVASDNLVEKFLFRIEDDVFAPDEIPGLTYLHSCLCPHKLTQNPDAEDAALMAAEKLLAFFESGKIDYENEKVLLNIPLLFWAYKKTDDEKFLEAAKKICSEAKEIIFNSSTKKTSSICWQAYGTSLAAKFIPDDTDLELFRTLTEKYFTSPEAVEMTDTSSAAIMCCALSEMCNVLRAADELQFGEEINSWQHKGAVILKTLVYDFAVQSSRTSNGLLYTTLPDGREECTFWGDYFYMEALTRFIRPNWNLF